MVEQGYTISFRYVTYNFFDELLLYTLDTFYSIYCSCIRRQGEKYIGKLLLLAYINRKLEALDMHYRGVDPYNFRSKTFYRICHKSRKYTKGFVPFC